MSKKEFACEVLTPLFLGGADMQRPELRAPSIRGAMRYWYRALVGGTLDSSLDSLHQIESAIFGSAENGGPLSSQLRTKGKPLPVSYQKSPPVGKNQPAGIDYLLWSVALAKRPYLMPGEKFDFLLRTHLNENALRHGEIAFWLLTNLGALGARANRGAGSFQAVSGASEMDFSIASTPDELKQQLEKGLEMCRNILGGTWVNFGKTAPEFDVFHPDYCRVSIVADQSNGWETYKDALNAIGRHFANYRTHINPLGKSDHDAVLEWFKSSGKARPDLKRPVFGLPLAFRYTNGPQDEIRSGQGDRRGSPLHIHITRLKTGRYVGLLTLFKSQFLPSGIKLKLKNHGWEAPPPTDYTIVEKFMDTFPVHEGVTL